MWHTAVFPLPSTASHVTVMFPIGSLVPDGGLQTIEATFPELSIAVGFSHITRAVDLPSSVCLSMWSTQMICGSSESVEYQHQISDIREHNFTSNKDTRW